MLAVLPVAAKKKIVKETPAVVPTTDNILTEQEERAKDAMKAQGLEIMETMTKGDWCAIAAKKIR